VRNAFQEYLHFVVSFAGKEMKDKKFEGSEKN
jgi:hypothetical protein